MFVCHLQDLIITRKFFVSQELFLIILFLKNKFPNSINSTNIILLCICSNFNSQIYTLLIF